MSEANGRRRWLVVGVPRKRRYGWEIRAQWIFQGLQRRRRSFVMHRPTPGVILRLVGMHASHLMPGTAIAATDFLPSAALAVASRMARLEVLDVHDHPVHQRQALGFKMGPGERARLNGIFDANIASF